MPDPHALKIYIDGSAFGNPGHEGGLAGIAEFPESFGREPECIFVESYDGTTNNRMELRACIRALKYVQNHGRELGSPRVIILTDSAYIVENFMRAPSWRKNGWRNRHGRPIENRELWRAFLSIRSRMPVRVDIQWNLGKSTPVLRAVDKLAKAAAKNPLRVTDRGYRKGKVSRHGTTDQGVAPLFPANNQELIIRVYAHTVAGKDDCKVKFTVFSEKERAFSPKYTAYAAQSDKGEIHRHSSYKVRFNDNPNYPVFTVIESLGNWAGAA